MKTINSAFYNCGKYNVPTHMNLKGLCRIPRSEYTCTHVTFCSYCLNRIHFLFNINTISIMCVQRNKRETWTCTRNIYFFFSEKQSPNSPQDVAAGTIIHICSISSTSGDTSAQRKTCVWSMFIDLNLFSLFWKRNVIYWTLSDTLTVTEAVESLKLKL